MAVVPDNGICVDLEELIRLRSEASALSLGAGRGGSALAGNYRSLFRGRGMDFEEVRNYQPGDDIRRMDWRVTARTLRPHTKLFREERERPVILCVDGGASMRFATRNAFKSVQACRVAALFGWAALDNHDRVGCVIFSSAQARELRPAAGKRALLHCLQQLAQASAEQPAPPDPQAFVQTLLRLRHLARHGCQLILISDFISLEREAEQHLAILAQHNAVLAIQIYDPLEAALPPAGQYAFSDGQRNQTLWTRDTALRQRYQGEFTERCQQLSEFCRQQRIQYLSLSTADDAGRALTRSAHSMPATARVKTGANRL